MCLYALLSLKCNVIFELQMNAPITLVFHFCAVRPVDTEIKAQFKTF
jgi:hypothetical protein